MENKDYKKTILACHMGYISQAIVVSLPPILFTVFIQDMGIPIRTIGNLLVFGFAVQLTVDFFAVGFIDKIGYRLSAVIAHGFSALGLIAMGVLTGFFQLGVLGLGIAIAIYSFGSGLIEVLMNPLLDALPGDNKSARLSMLHSIYCWGEVGTILLSAIALKFLFGGGLWWLLPILWSLIPLNNFLRFRKAPIVPPKEKHEKMRIKELMADRFFIVALVSIACAGATEQVIIQWSSYFVETSLQIPKVIGDIFGPCLFAAMMGVGRVFQTRIVEKHDILNVLLLGSAGCTLLYLVVSLSPSSSVALLACGLCGLFVSVLWPGIIILSALRFPRGGTAMFGILAISGDIGCAFSTWFVGSLAGLFDLRVGIFLSTIFPALIFVGLLLFRIKK